MRPAGYLHGENMPVTADANASEEEAIPYRFVAYIDEAGDQGFVFRENPKGGSSRWFVLSAVIVTKEADTNVLPLARDIRKRIGIGPKDVIHFMHLGHERRVSIADAISRANLDIVSVIINKKEISGPVKLIFEHCRNLNYDDMKSYIEFLRGRTPERTGQFGDLAPGPIRIHWPTIRSDLFEIHEKTKYAGLQLADCAASSIKCALELSPYGFTEHRYAKIIKPRVNQRRGNYTSYGLKFFPHAPSMHWVRKYYS
ncbi:MAG: DUF3800 domain-containing protein [Rhodomicrobium sp.]|nr:DUF3800 domain-containing protein [Rhodomicrobium sp.]